MGLKDKLKKSSDGNKPEIIGGLADSGEMPVEEASSKQKAAPPPPSPPPPPTPPASAGSTLGGGTLGQKEEKSSVDSGSLSGLDLFTDESADAAEENTLAAELPEVDMHDLLNECKEMAARLAEYGDDKDK